MEQQTDHWYVECNHIVLSLMQSNCKLGRGFRPQFVNGKDMHGKERILTRSTVQIRHGVRAMNSFV